VDSERDRTTLEEREREREITGSGNCPRKQHDPHHHPYIPPASVLIKQSNTLSKSTIRTTETPGTTLAAHGLWSLELVGWARVGRGQEAGAGAREAQPLANRPHVSRSLSFFVQTRKPISSRGTHVLLTK